MVYIHHVTKTFYKIFCLVLWRLRNNNKGICLCKIFHFSPHNLSWFHSSEPQLFIRCPELRGRKSQIPTFCLYTLQFCWFQYRNSKFTEDKGIQELLHPAFWCQLCKKICVLTQPLSTSTWWTLWVGSRQHVFQWWPNLLRGIRNVEIHLLSENSEIFQ